MQLFAFVLNECYSTMTNHAVKVYDEYNLDHIDDPVAVVQLCDPQNHIHPSVYLTPKSYCREWYTRFMNSVIDLHYPNRNPSF
jgi:hypothetical protein